MKLRFFAVLFLFFVAFNIAFGQEEVSLEQVISLALEKGYDVRIARTASEAAETDKAYAWGAFVPQINATASTVRNNNEQELRFQETSRNNSGKAESKNVSAAVQLQWILFDGTRMFATRERISSIAEQGELLVKDQMVNTIATIITGYYDIVRQKQQLKAIQEQMSVSEERVKLAERKLQVGTGIKPELLQARVDFNAQRMQVLQQESIIAQLKQQLNALVGLQLPTVFDVADTIIIDLNLKPEELSQNVENTNFGLMAARENMHIASLSLRERRAEYLPFLSFNAAYNYSKTDNIRLINPFSALYSQQNGYNYGLTVNVPIITNFNTRRLSQQAKIEVNRQTLLYEQARNNINVGLKNAYVNYDNAKKILIIEEETIGLAKENVFIALEGFKRGVTTYIELRTAQQSLADAYNRLILARYNAKFAETELLRLSGGLLK
ncbi:TolC family protein [Fulvivirgaceae bacterium PWU4]|uniref:TolC family protein n=1 Tax=Chryseosolibacter histidini TaxID=2782349 RepID=A0AAP2DLQ3_9BACT|nr:TolC family protein [Chryseosolibacter histidini]MBT1697227.1 TolC family protein [Chryseosolibacter histidini]